MSSEFQNKPLTNVTRRAWNIYRLSEEAQSGFEQAKREAQLSRHNYVGTEHLLLGLLGEPATIANAALMDLGMSHEKMRKRVIELEKEGNTDLILPPTTLTPRARKVMDIAHRNSIAFGYRSVYSPHLAIALLEANEGIGRDLMEEAGITLDILESSILQLMPDRQEEEKKEKQRVNAEAEERLPTMLEEARQQPKIPANQMSRIIVRAREGDTSARQALVKHFLEKTALFALDHCPTTLAKHEAVEAANGILLQLACDPPKTGFEISLEERIRHRMAELGSKG